MDQKYAEMVEEVRRLTREMDWTLDEAEGQTGIPATTLRRAINRGALKAHKRGGRWEVAHADLDAFAAGYHARPTRRK